MRLLHLFAGPFPTVQGTQVLVDQTCRLLAAAGHEVHLLTYAHAGAHATAPPPFTIHRLADSPRFRGERSGPAWQKPLLDVRLAARCRSLARRLEPELVQAHHYEALAAARLADPTGIRPLVFQLHALLAPELGTYLPRRLGPLAGWFGQAADRLLPRLADERLVLSEEMRRTLVAAGFAPHEIEVIDPPALPPPTLEPVPDAVDDDRLVAVYVGNLDRYQGLEQLLDGLVAVAPSVRNRLRVDIVTESEAAELERRLQRDGLAAFVRVVPHGSPKRAWTRLARADLCLIPRRSAGGVPIKLVNALLAGRPTIVDPTLARDLRHGEEVWAVEMGDPRAVAAAITRLTDDELLRARLGRGARRAAAGRHAPARYVATLERVYRRAINTREAARRTARERRA